MNKPWRCACVRLGVNCDCVSLHICLYGICAAMFSRYTTMTTYMLTPAADILAMTMQNDCA